jgi:cobalamin synthase
MTCVPIKKHVFVAVVDSSYQYYIRRCPLSQVQFTHETSWGLALFPTVGALTGFVYILILLVTVGIETGGLMVSVLKVSLSIPTVVNNIKTKSYKNLSV